MTFTYGGTTPTGLFSLPSTTGTNVSAQKAKKPDYIKTKSGHWCPQCDSMWVSSPYDPDDDPPEHRLWCVDGWTPEYHVVTATVWIKWFEEALAEEEPDDGE